MEDIIMLYLSEEGQGLVEYALILFLASFQPAGFTRQGNVYTSTDHPAPSPKQTDSKT